MRGQSAPRCGRLRSYPRTTNTTSQRPCSTRSLTDGAFGPLHGEMLVLLAAEQARAVGIELSFVPIELDIHALRILRGEITFPELRGWFAARLTPIKRRPWPQKAQ